MNSKAVLFTFIRVIQLNPEIVNVQHFVIASASLDLAKQRIAQLHPLVGPVVGAYVYTQPFETLPVVDKDTTCSLKQWDLFQQHPWQNYVSVHP